MTQAPSVPEGILLQMMVIDPRGEEGGYRIYQDGRYETKPMGQPWTFDRALTPAQMQAVRAALAEANPEQLTSRLQTVEESSEDSATLWAQVATENETVRSIGVQSPHKIPEIETLSAHLVEIFKKTGT